MKKINTNSKKGFTIIEVVLVLAIAGLIFMMVFTALPALQRSQRDTQRNNDIARFQAAVTQYQSNNRGKLPTSTAGTGVMGADTSTDLTDLDGNNCATKNGTWCYFYASYLLVGSAGATDTFTDPDGEPYSLLISACNPDSKTGAKENTICKDGQRSDVTFDNQSLGVDLGSPKQVSHAISIVTNATCDGENAYYSSGSRKIAILYKREGGGVICLNN
ncbi:MAG: type II secretion system protein [Candidatus Saccharibacteria bacterium]|nr:type II secretion system protein [Candidatus Saccharibacteria bacterium]